MDDRRQPEGALSRMVVDLLKARAAAYRKHGWTERAERCEAEIDKYREVQHVG